MAQGIPVEDRISVAAGKKPRNLHFYFAAVMIVFVLGGAIFSAFKEPEKIVETQSTATPKLDINNKIAPKAGSSVDQLAGELDAKKKEDDAVEVALREQAAKQALKGSPSRVTADQFKRDVAAGTQVTVSERDADAQQKLDVIYAAPMRARGGSTGGTKGGQKSSADDLATKISDAETKARQNAREDREEALAIQERLTKASQPRAEKALSAQQQLESDASTISPATRLQAAPKGCVVYELTSIPVSNMNAINSDFQGDIRAQVTDDVYGSFGTCLAIPKGSKINGLTGNFVRGGQTRSMVAFRSLILPNGKSVALTGSRGAGRDGTAGVEGEVNNHFWQQFGAAFMIGMITPNQVTVTNNNVGGATSTSTVLGTAASESVRVLLDRARQVQPTITTAASTRFIVMTSRDLVMEHYSESNR